MELADPDGVLCICLHFVRWMCMNAFLAFLKFLGLINQGIKCVYFTFSMQ